MKFPLRSSIQIEILFSSSWLIYELVVQSLSYPLARTSCNIQSFVKIAPLNGKIDSDHIFESFVPFNVQQSLLFFISSWLNRIHSTQALITQGVIFSSISWIFTFCFPSKSNWCIWCYSYWFSKCHHGYEFPHHYYM